MPTNNPDGEAKNRSLASMVGDIVAEAKGDPSVAFKGALYFNSVPHIRRLVLDPDETDITKAEDFSTAVAATIYVVLNDGAPRKVGTGVALTLDGEVVGDRAALQKLVNSYMIDPWQL